MLLGLGHIDAENTILHRSLDVVLVDTGWEGKRSGELPKATLRNPVLALRLLNLGLLDFNGGLILGSGTLTPILNGCLVVLVVAILSALSDGISCSGTLNKAGRWSAGGGRALGVALDGQGVQVGELDLNVLLLDSWKFTMELIAVLVLLDVELGSESLHLSAVGTIRATTVLVEVVEKTEEGMKGGVGGNES